MEDLKREFGADFKVDFETQTLELDLPNSHESPPTPDLLIEIPVPNQLEVQETGAQHHHRRDSGTDRQPSHSPIPRPFHDAADTAITGSRVLKVPPQEKLLLTYSMVAARSTSAPSTTHASLKMPADPRMSTSAMRGPRQSQDDFNINGPNGSRRADRDRAMREIESLRKQLSEAHGRIAQAERVAREFEHRLRNTPTETTSKNDAELARENRILKAQLDDARSHIFSLQPYRKDLTPDEVGRQFDDLVHGVTEWVNKFVVPIIDDPDRLAEVLTMAKKRPADFQKLKKHIHDHADLTNGCLFPETDVDIIIAIVMRFLHDHVFQHVLSGIVSVDAITYLETSMQTAVEPKRDLFALRTWRAEALDATICGPEYQRNRPHRIRALTVDLADAFRPLRGDQEFNKFGTACLEAVIKPAVELNEKLATSTHHFYIDLNPYIVFNTRQEAVISPDLPDNLRKLQCENILQHRKNFVFAKLNPQPTPEQMKQDLVNVATIVPAVHMRQIGKGDAIKPPMMVRPQQGVVAWGTPQEREKFIDGERTLLSQICYPLREQGTDRTFWNPFRV